MTSKRIFQYSMALPLVVPLLVSPLFLLGIVPQNGVLGGLLGILVYSGIIGGIPYAILGLIISFWMIDKPLKSIRQMLLFSPIFMVAVFAICYAIFFVMSLGGIPTFDYLSRRVLETLSLSVLVLVFGYFYVGIAFGLVRLFGSDPGIES